MIPRFLDSSLIQPGMGNNVKVFRFNFYNFFTTSGFTGLNNWSFGAILVLQFDKPFFNLNVNNFCNVIRGFSI